MPIWSPERHIPTQKIPKCPPPPAMLRVLPPMFKPLAKYQVVEGWEKLLQKVENRRSCEFVGRSAAQREQGGRQGERRAHPLPHPFAVFFCLHLFDPSPRSELLERAKSNCNFWYKICTCYLFYRSKTNFGFAAGNANAVTSACFNRSEVSKFTQIVSTFFLFVAKQVARFCGTFYLSLNFIFFSFEVRYVHRSPHRPQLKVCFLFLAEQMFRETAPLFC